MSDIRNTRQSELDFAVNPITDSHYYSIYDTSQKKIININLKDLTKSIALDFSIGVGYTDAEREALNLLLSKDFKVAVKGDSFFDGDIILGLNSSIGGAAENPSGVSFSGDLNTSSLISVDGKSEIKFLEESASFSYNNSEVFQVSDSGVLINPDKTSDIELKILSDESQASNFNNDTALHVTEKGDIGIGTDSPRADLEMHQGRVILGVKETTEIHPTEDSLSILGGKALGIDSVAAQDGVSSGEKSFSVNAGEASGENSFAANSGESTGFASTAFNSSTSSGINSFSTNRSFANGESSFSANSSVVNGDFSLSANSSTVDGSYSAGFGTSNTIESASTNSFVGGSNSSILGSRVFSFGFSNNVSTSASGLFILGSSNLFSATSGGSDCSIIGSLNTISGSSGVSNSSILGASNSIQSSSSGVFGFSNRIQEESENSLIIGSDCEVEHKDTISIGFGCTPDQNREMVMSNSSIPTLEKNQQSKFFLSLDQDGYVVGQRIPLTTHEYNESIKILENGIYDFDISLVGRGCLKYTSRVQGVGDSTNWQFRIKGNLGVDQDANSTFTSAPFVYSTPMSTVFGQPIDPNDPYQPKEIYFSTKNETIQTPNQFCEIEGLEPYVLYSNSSKTLEIGVVRSKEWSYYDISEMTAGDVSASNVYSIPGSLIIKSLNAEEYLMDFDLIVAIFNKDQAYLDSVGADLSTSSYTILKDGVTEVPSVGITNQGTGDFGQSELTHLSGGQIGYSSVCFGKIEMDFNADWHAVVDINKQVSLKATDPNDEFELNCQI